jgi:hypothetical protein
MTYFVERQRFTQPWLWGLLLGVAALFSYGAFRQLVQGVPWGTKPASDPVLFVVWLLTAVALPALFALSHLRTEVRTDGIRIRFFPFHVRPRVWTWETIAHVEAREYSPLGEFGGWGIRLGFRGWAYNVAGNQGIEITFRAGHRFLVGTQDPDGFMRAVDEARGPLH